MIALLLTLILTSPHSLSDEIEYHVTKKEALAKLYTNPEVKKRLEKCREYHKTRSQSHDDQKIYRCLVEGEPGENEPAIEPISPRLMKELTTVISPVVISKDPKIKPSQYEGLQVTDMEKALEKHEESVDPALKALEDYFFQKLEDKFHKRVNSKLQKVVDHKVFQDMYERQVSRNIIAGISNYCMDADPDRAYILFKDPEKNKTVREKNLQELRQYKGKSNKEYSDWTVCMISIQHICHGSTLKDEKDVILYSYDPEVNENGVTILKKDKKLSGITPEDYDYSKQRACTLLRFIKDSRQTLIQAAHIKDILAKIAKQEVYSAQGLDDEVFTFTKDDTLEKLIQISSKEALYGNNNPEESNLKKTNEKMIENFKKNCLANPNNKTKCDPYLLNKEKAEAIAVEVSLKTNAMYEKLQKIKDDKEKLKLYLEEEGYEEPELTNLLKEKNIVDTIIKNYKTEREYLIKNLTRSFQKVSTQDSSEPNSDKSYKQKIETIKTDLESRVDNFEQLIHYNNIIEGHMKLHDEENKELDDSNLSLIYKEVNDLTRNSTYAKTKSKIEKENVEDLHKVLTEKGLYKNEVPQNILPLPPELINSNILTYGSVKLEEANVEELK